MMPLVGSSKWTRYLREEKTLLMLGNERLQRLWALRSFERARRDLLTQHRIESTAAVQEVDVSGRLAFCWTDLTVRIVPRAGGNATVRGGSALDILRNESNGSWVVVRDANLLSPSS